MTKFGISYYHKGVQKKKTNREVFHISIHSIMALPLHHQHSKEKYQISMCQGLVWAVDIFDKGPDVLRGTCA